MVELNVISMNLRKETEEDGGNNWPERIGLVVRLINERCLPKLESRA